MTAVPFVKAVASGNDFLIIDGSVAPADPSAFTRAICDRHNGIGADGVEWISTGSGDHHVAARLINADGSEAEVSGNGTRCVAAHWIQQHGGDQVRVLTGAGVKQCNLRQHDGNRFAFEMNMGAPRIEGELEVAGVRGIALSMGNPQFVVFVESLNFDWKAKGLEIQNSGRFSQGVNVDFVRVLDSNRIDARFFERGAGATQSSGTGSCASAVAAIHTKRAKSPVDVVAPGGTQTVRWDGEVYLSGDAYIIARGEYVSLR
jgi:diaminopimelate epimerase